MLSLENYCLEIFHKSIKDQVPPNQPLVEFKDKCINLSLIMIVYYKEKSLKNKEEN